MTWWESIILVTVAVVGVGSIERTVAQGFRELGENLDRRLSDLEKRLSNELSCLEDHLSRLDPPPDYDED